MSGVAILASLLLLAVVSAQDCTQDDVDTSAGTKPHKDYVELFVQCDPNLTGHVTRCPPGTLYDTSDGRCLYEHLVTDTSCDCRRRRNCASVCKDKYYQCTQGGGAIQLCNAGQVYSVRQEQCVDESQLPGARDYTTFCVRESNVTMPPTTSSDVPCANRSGAYLRRASSGSPCQFDFGKPNEAPMIRNNNCARGTSFDEEKCGCTGPDIPCHTGSPPQKCPVTVKVDFENGLETLTLQKGELKAAHVSVKTEGTTYTEVGAEMEPGDDMESYLYMPYFVDNEMRSPSAVSITLSAQNQNNFTLLTNAWPQKCKFPPTLEVKAVMTFSRLAVEINVKGATDDGTIPDSDSLSGSIDTFNQDVKFLLKFENKRISVQLINTSGRVEELTSTKVIGDKIISRSCGFLIGHGLKGTVKEFLYYQSCKDMSLIDTSV